jgi:hypothetical protein
MTWDTTQPILARQRYCNVTFTPDGPVGTHMIQLLVFVFSWEQKVT